VEGAGLGSCLVVGFDFSGVQSLGSVSMVIVAYDNSLSWILSTFQLCLRLIYDTYFGNTTLWTIQVWKTQRTDSTQPSHIVQRQ
jgi:hypothetical protein